MNRHCLLVLMLVLSLAGCQSHQRAQLQEPESRTGAVSTASSTAQSGPQVVADLTARYNDVRINCGTPSTPAFLCRGIVLRSTVPGPGYSTWNPSPHSVTSGGVSFSFLGKDSKFQKLVFGQNSGFIFYPVLANPVGKLKIEILCAYPIDGWTQLRDKPGCGAHPYFPTQSRRCQSMGISTAEQWMTHWRAAPSSPSAYQCSFDVRDNMNNLGADSFYQSIRARSLLGAAWFPQQNELILATWPQNVPTQLPIQAFFYVENGLANAQHDQRDFYSKTGGMVVPIIKITLPATQTANATFAFNLADQVR
ncbi:halovibrin HvnA [Pseudomonas kribbensis]|uniref:Halovibrin HvnA n=1 Tax=Pseudomonas kribbensis TaxID=1628086 RepID=A0A345RQF5_9PSED|nr:halovibrin HvnA [Pseudomonas kribbensis]AXI61521.1 halovibrin HvnA [Pseudomonas kribbensis]